MSTTVIVLICIAGYIFSIFSTRYSIFRCNKELDKWTNEAYVLSFIPFINLLILCISVFYLLFNGDSKFWKWFIYQNK